MTVVVGCDPGMDGAIVVVRAGKAVRVFDMPTVSKKTAGGKGRKPRTMRSIDRVEAARVIGLARDYCYPDSPVAVVERVGARQGEAASSSFRFGDCYGVLTGAALGHGMGLLTPTPQTWKKTVGLPAGSSKQDSLDLAIKLFPEAEHLLRRKKDHGRADALLVAHYHSVVES